MSRPGCEIKKVIDQVFEGSCTIDEQVGFYSQSSQPGVGDLNAKANETPAAADQRFADVRMKES